MNTDIEKDDCSLDPELSYFSSSLGSSSSELRRVTVTSSSTSLLIGELGSFKLIGEQTERDPGSAIGTLGELSNRMFGELSICWPCDVWF